FSGGSCVYSRGLGLPIPGLPDNVETAIVSCINGHLVLSLADVDCGGDIADAPWSTGAPWTEDECVADPSAPPSCEGSLRCVRVREDGCCADVEACDFDGARV